MAEPLRYRRPHADTHLDPRARSRLITPGVVDELGERQFTVDASSEILLETLRFRREFGDNPAFETALRAQVESTRPLRHAALATVTAVDRDDTALCLISKLPSGRRLSELPPADTGWTSALKTVRELMPALLVLHEHGVAHGALSARRVIMTRDGRLVLVEHVLASAIEALHLTPAGLRALDIVVGDGDGDEPVRFSEHTDLVQMGFLALSLLVGRQLPATDFPARVPALLDEFVHGVGSAAAAGRVRTWLERAMQIDGADPFASSQEAHAAFDALSHDVAVRLAESAGALMAFESEAGAPEEARRDPAPAIVGGKRPASQAQPAARTSNTRPEPVPAPEQPRSAEDVPRHVPAGAARPSGRNRALTWMIAGLAVLAIGEGAVLLRMLYLRQADTSTAVSPSSAAVPTPVDSTSSANAATTPEATPALAATVTPTPTLAPRPLVTPLVTPIAKPETTPAPRPTPTPSAKPVVTPAKSVAPPARPTGTPAVAGAAGASAFGGLTVTSPIDLQIFRNGVLLGSTAAPIAVADGRYSLEFVNAALGFRVTLPATVAGGQMTTLKVPVPNGHVSINAVPWAEVTIDGRAVGQTPLANLSLPIGTHDVVFTHPQFGEKRQTVVVTVDGIARVTQNYR